MALFKKLLKVLMVLAVLSVLGGLGFIRYIGAWNRVFPSHVHETVPPEISATITGPAVLLFTKTNSFRHKDAIPAGTAFFKALGERRDWSVFHTENSAVFNTVDLARFDVVVFHNTSGDVLSDEQHAVFETWLQAGGGWVGIHAAGDGSHKDWPWYVENLVGADFTAHIMGPQFQVADVHTEAAEHPAMKDVPSVWQHEEEWYSWEKSPRPNGFTILATIDEDSYSPMQKIGGAENDLHMGDHPVVWSRCIGLGRALYSALGHQAAAYDVPEHQQLLENALQWAMSAEACGAAQSGEQE